MSQTLKPLIIGDLTIPIPIIQGGMGVRVSTASLASAVANCGAAGTIATVALGVQPGEQEKDYIGSSKKNLRQEIRRAREQSKGVIGVNILVALSNYEDLARVAVEEGVDYIISGAGLPLRLPEIAAGSSVKLIPIVSSARVAELIIKSWNKRYNRMPDAIVVEGPLAGGHIGFSYEEAVSPKKHSLETIVAEVLAVTRRYAETSDCPEIPVIAAGGIFDGNDIAKFLTLGASGVQLGTRFVATDECSMSAAYKQRYIDAKEGDVVMIKSPVGLPGSVLRTAFIDKIQRGETAPISCYYQCLKTCDPSRAPYCIAKALINATDEDLLDEGIIFAGRNVTRVKEVVPVKTLIDSLVAETQAALGETRA